MGRGLGSAHGAATGWLEPGDEDPLSCPAFGEKPVYTWGINAFRCDFDDTRDPDFEPLADAGRSFTDEGDNIFLVKVNRWISL